MSLWFRFYEETIHDPKVLRLPEAMRWHWVAILCVASNNDGVLPPTQDIGFLLRQKPAKVATIISALVGAKLLDLEDGKYIPHNWKKRQYKHEDRGKDSYVYVIGATWGGKLKIGFSKNPWARLGDLQSANHEKLSVLAVFRCKSHSEVELHGVLHDYRGNGEWFSLPSNVYDAIRVAADDKATYESLVATLRDLLRSATTEQKQTTEQSRADARPAFEDDFLKALAEAFGRPDTDLTRAKVWLSKGYSSTMILETVREVLARGTDVGSLGYFDSILAERHANRQETPSERAAAKVDMDKVAKMFKETGVWSKYAGPEPGMIGCRCPPEILSKHGIITPGARRMDA